MNLESISSENINKELAYLFGVYLTDGYISKDKKFILQVIDKEFSELTLNCIKKNISTCKANVFERLPVDILWPNGKISKSQKKYCISAGFTNFKEFFEKQTGNKHHIPYIIWNASLDIKRWFIAGVMDGDGYITYHTRKNGIDKQWTIGLGKSENSWVYEFKELLEKLKIRIYKPYRNLTNGGVPFVRFNIGVDDFISRGLFFTIKRKQIRLKKLIDKRSETRRLASEGMKK